MVCGLLSRVPEAFPAGPQAPVTQGTECGPSKSEIPVRVRAGVPVPYHRRRLFTVAERAGLAPRFWSKVDQSGGPEACWPWKRARSLGGYGQWHPYAKVHTPAHRFALALKLDRNLRPDEVAMHLCHNPPCCNPTHLKPGSHSDNAKHSATDGRAYVGELNAMARLTDADVLDLRRRAASEFRRGWLAEEGRRLNMKSGIVGRIVRGDYWPHLPGAVAIVTNRNLGLPAVPRGYCVMGHKRAASGHCPCRTEAMRRYRARDLALAAVSP